MASRGIFALRAALAPTPAAPLGRRLLSTTAVRRAHDAGAPAPGQTPESRAHVAANLNQWWFWKWAAPIVGVVLYAHLVDAKLDEDKPYKISNLIASWHKLVRSTAETQEESLQSVLRDYAAERERAELVLFFQSMENPPKHRFNQPYVFDSKSPMDNPVGATAKVPQYTYAHNF